MLSTAGLLVQSLFTVMTADRENYSGPSPRHTPGWFAAVHGSDSRRAITSTITAGENCGTQTGSIQS